MARLLRCRFWKSEPSRLPMISLDSPALGGGATRIASAPQSASVRTQDGPARASVRSITLNRDSGNREVLSCGAAVPGSLTGLCMVDVLQRECVCGLATDGSPEKARHTPQNRVIQYAAAFRFHH